MTPMRGGHHPPRIVGSGAQGSPVAVPFSFSFPRPGRPATLFTADDPVGATQNSDASVGCDTSLTGGSCNPLAVMVPTPAVGTLSRSNRHSRRFSPQIWLPGVHVRQLPPSAG